MTAASAHSAAITLGATPRVHLLPKEIEGQRKVQAIRRGLLAALAAAVLLVIVAVGAVSFLLVSAGAAQSNEQAQGLALATQLKKYGAVTGVQTQVDAITTAQPHAVAGEILWQPFIASVQSTLPAGTSITSFSAKLDTPSAVTTSSKPLENAHVATVSVTALGPQSVLTAWLAQLTTIKGVVGATPGAFTVGQDPSLYVVNVDLLVNGDVVADRFAAGKK